MKNFGKSLLELWKQLGLNQRVSLTVASLAVVAGLVAIALWSRRPDYQLLYGNLGDKDAAAIISYLEAQNVPHQVTAGGTAVEVPTDQVYKLRMDLAGKGLPGGDGVGFEIFDKGQFGLSDFVQRTNYLRAVQGELARTITQLAGVRAARVMIVQPENRLLLTDQNVKSTASVFVDLGGGRLDPDQVNAIRHLVANSVQGLQPDEVAVVDNHGHTISEDLKQDPTLGTASSQMRYRQQVEDYFAKKVESMLAQVIGPGNAVVRVSADIDTEATTVTEEKFDPEGQVVRSETTTDDKSKSVEARASGGAVGVSCQRAGQARRGHDRRSPADARPPTATGSTRPRPTRSTARSQTPPASPGRINRSPPRSSSLPGRPPPGRGGSKRTDGGDQESAPDGDQRPRPQGRPGPESRQTRHAPGNDLPDARDRAAAGPAGESRWTDWVEAASRYAAVGGAALVLLLFVRMLSQQRPEPVPVEVLTLPPECGRGRCRRPATSPRNGQRTDPPEAGQRRRRAARLGGRQRTRPRIPAMADIDYSKLSRQQRLARLSHRHRPGGGRRGAAPVRRRRGRAALPRDVAISHGRRDRSSGRPWRNSPAIVAQSAGSRRSAACPTPSAPSGSPRAISRPRRSSAGSARSATSVEVIKDISEMEGRADLQSDQARAAPDDRLRPLLPRERRRRRKSSRCSARNCARR